MKDSKQTRTPNPWMEAVLSLEKLIDAELLDVSEGADGSPRVVMARDLYDAFFFSDFMEPDEGISRRDRALLYILAMFSRAVRRIPSLRRRAEGWVRGLFRRRRWFDEKRALAFLAKVRFLINWRRGYVAGLRNYGQDDLDPRSEDDMLRKLFLADNVWITFYVVGADYRPLLIGRWVSDRFELRKWEAPDKE